MTRRRQREADDAEDEDEVVAPPARPAQADNGGQQQQQQQAEPAPHQEEQQAEQQKEQQKAEPPQQQRPQSVVVHKPRVTVMDEQAKKRSRKLFGVILGTLEKTQKTAVDVKRQEIEAKLQERLERERQEMHEKRERDRLAQRRAAINADHQRRKETRDVWRNQKRLMAGFLLTEAKPALPFLPAKLLPDEQETLERARAQAAEQIALLEKEDADAHAAALSRVDQLQLYVDDNEGDGTAAMDTAPAEAAATESATTTATEAMAAEPAAVEV